MIVARHADKRPSLDRHRMSVSKILLAYLYVICFNNNQIICVLTVEILMHIVKSSYGGIAYIAPRHLDQIL